MKLLKSQLCTNGEACLHVTCMCYCNQIYDNVNVFVRTLRRTNKYIRINVYFSHCMGRRLQQTLRNMPGN